MTSPLRVLVQHVCSCFNHSLVSTLSAAVSLVTVLRPRKAHRCRLSSEAQYQSRPREGGVAHVLWRASLEPLYLWQASVYARAQRQPLCMIRPKNTPPPSLIKPHCIVLPKVDTWKNNLLALQAPLLYLVIYSVQQLFSHIADARAKCPFRRAIFDDNKNERCFPDGSCSYWSGI